MLKYILSNCDFETLQSLSLIIYNNILLNNMLGGGHGGGGGGALMVKDSVKAQGLSFRLLK